jgi:hypothetical protein
MRILLATTLLLFALTPARADIETAGELFVDLDDNSRTETCAATATLASASATSFSAVIRSAFATDLNLSLCDIFVARGERSRLSSIPRLEP